MAWRPCGGKSRRECLATTALVFCLWDDRECGVQSSRAVVMSEHSAPQLPRVTRAAAAKVRVVSGRSPLPGPDTEYDNLSLDVQTTRRICDL